MSYIYSTISPASYSAVDDFFGVRIKRNPTNNKIIASGLTSYLTNFGRAWIFNFSSPDTFTLSTKLDSTNRASGDFFGIALEANGNRYYAGTPGKNCVHVFDSPAAPTSTQTYTLTAVDYATNYADYANSFGYSLGLVSNNLLVGAPEDQKTYTGGGAVYSYFLTGGAAQNWSNLYRERIVPADNAANDNFGFCISVDGTNMVIGAPGRLQGAYSNAGAVYYYTFSSATSSWSFQQKINPPNPVTGGQFGFAVDLKNDRLVVGAPYATGTGGANAQPILQDGNEYYYTLVGSTWTYNSTLTCFDLATSPKNLGYSVALSSNNAPSPSYAVVAGGPIIAGGFTGTDPQPGGFAVFNNINNNVYSSTLCRNYLSATWERVGVSFITDYNDFVIAGAPKRKDTSSSSTPGAIFLYKDVFVQPPYPVPEIQPVIPSYRIEYNGLPISEFDIVASNGATNFSMSPAIAGITVDPSTGHVSGTYFGLGTKSTNFYASNLPYGGTSAPLPITFVFNTAPSNPIIQSNQAVSIGNDAGNTQSVNVVMGLAFNTINSSLDVRESQWMNEYTNYGTCMPGQIHKNSLWKPTGTGGTYRPSGLNEFRTGYRWSQIKTGNAILVSINKNIQRGNGLTPGLDLGTAIITATGNGSPIYTGGSTPYSFYLYGTDLPAGPTTVRKPSSGWTTAGGAGASVTWTNLYATNGGGKYTIYIKDYLGCGTLDDRINVVAQFYYP